MCPPSFIEITCKMREISPLSNYTYNNSVHETIQLQNPISPIGKWDNNNSVHETGQEEDPIPLWGMG